MAPWRRLTDLSVPRMAGGPRRPMSVNALWWKPARLPKRGDHTPVCSSRAACGVWGSGLLPCLPRFQTQGRSHTAVSW